MLTDLSLNDVMSEFVTVSVSDQRSRLIMSILKVSESTSLLRWLTWPTSQAGYGWQLGLAYNCLIGMLLQDQQWTPIQEHMLEEAI